MQVDGGTRRVISMPKNPMDKSTIVSIYPREIVEIKATIFPGRFVIPPGTFKNPSLLVVKGSSWWRTDHTDESVIEIPVPSIQIADSVIKDWANSVLLSDMDGHMPGLFWVVGEKTIGQVKAEASALLIKAKARQDNWFRALVRMGDILWSRTNGNPTSISDDMRLAAESLEMDKPWMKDFTAMELIPCPACGVMRDDEFPVCQSCHTIVNKEQYKKLGLERAS